MKIECICSRTFLLKLKQKLIAWFECKKFEHFQRISEMTLNHSMHWKIYIKVLSVCTVQCAIIEFGVISCNFFGIWSMMRKLHGTSSRKNRFLCTDVIISLTITVKIRLLFHFILLQHRSFPLENNSGMHEHLC